MYCLSVILFLYVIMDFQEGLDYTFFCIFCFVFVYTQIYVRERDSVCVRTRVQVDNLRCVCYCLISTRSKIVLVAYDVWLWSLKRVVNGSCWLHRAKPVAEPIQLHRQQYCFKPARVFQFPNFKREFVLILLPVIYW